MEKKRWTTYMLAAALSFALAAAPSAAQAAYGEHGQGAAVAEDQMDSVTPYGIPDKSDASNSSLGFAQADDGEAGGSAFASSGALPQATPETDARPASEEAGAAAEDAAGRDLGLPQNGHTGEIGSGPQMQTGPVAPSEGVELPIADADASIKPMDSLGEGIHEEAMAGAAADGIETSEIPVAPKSEDGVPYCPEDGWYLIGTALPSGAHLAALRQNPSGALAAGAALALDASKTDAAVYWRLEANGDGSYRVQSFQSGLFLTAGNGRVTQEAYTGSPSQMWRFRRHQGKTYTSLAPDSDTSLRLALPLVSDGAAGTKAALLPTGSGYATWYVKPRSSPQVPVPGGGLYIYPGKSPAKALYIDGSSTSVGAPATLYKWLSRRGQWFALDPVGYGNLFRIRNVHSGLVLGVSGKASIGAGIVQQKASDAPGQVFRLVASSGGRCYIEHFASGLVLSLAGKSFANGTAIELQPRAAMSSRLWTLSPTDTSGKDTAGQDARLAKGYYRLQSLSGGALCASVTGSRNASGARLALRNGSDSERMVFQVLPLGGGEYAIWSLHSGKYIGMNRDTAENRYRVATRDACDLAESRWRIQKSKLRSGAFVFVNVGNPALVLSRDNASASGTELMAEFSDGGDGQYWAFQKLPNQMPLKDGQMCVICPEGDGALVLGAGEAASGGVRLHKAQKQPWEAYAFEHIGPGNVYRIRNIWSGKILSASGGSVSLAQDSSGDAGLWRVRSLGDARYRFANVKTGRMLALSGAVGQDAAVVAAQGASGQVWVMHTAKAAELAPTGCWLTISPKGTENVLEARGSGDAAYAQFGKADGSSSQAFKVSVSGGKARIQNMATGGCLAMDGGGVALRAKADDASQLWWLEIDGGRYAFRNAKTGAYLTSANPDCASGTAPTAGAAPLPCRLARASVAGWQSVSGGLRHLNADGSYAKNAFLSYEGRLVRVGGNGAIASGWFKYGAYYYYFNGAAGQVTGDARPYVGILYPARRAGYSRPEQAGPACNYRITVDRQHPCQVTVYTQYPGQSAFNVPVVSYLCSTGADATPTAPGERTVIHSGRWQELMGPSYGQYGMAILLRDGGGQWFVNGDYFHSLACGLANDHNLDPGSYNLLGSRASHGCVRLSVRNAYWQYNFIPDNTGVYVGDGLARPLRAIPQPYAGGAVDPTDPAYTGNYGYTENGTYYSPVGFH